MYTFAVPTIEMLDCLSRCLCGCGLQPTSNSATLLLKPPCQFIAINLSFSSSNKWNLHLIDMLLFLEVPCTRAYGLLLPAELVSFPSTTSSLGFAADVGSEMTSRFAVRLINLNVQGNEDFHLDFFAPILTSLLSPHRQ